MSHMSYLRILVHQAKLGVVVVDLIQGRLQCDLSLLNYHVHLALLVH
jgi:hypothetical protein